MNNIVAPFKEGDNKALNSLWRIKVILPQQRDQREGEAQNK